VLFARLNQRGDKYFQASWRVDRTALQIMQSGDGNAADNFGNDDDAAEREEEQQEIEDGDQKPLAKRKKDVTRSTEATKAAASAAVQEEKEDEDTTPRPPASKTYPTAKRRSKRKDGSVPSGPSRALNAYNFFFREERERWLAERESLGSTKEKSRELFSLMGKEIARRWKTLSKEEMTRYKALAGEDLIRYQLERKEFVAKESKKAAESKSSAGLASLSPPERGSKRAKKRAKSAQNDGAKPRTVREELQSMLPQQGLAVPVRNAENQNPIQNQTSMEQRMSHVESSSLSSLSALLRMQQHQQPQDHTYPSESISGLDSNPSTFPNSLALLQLQQQQQQQQSPDLLRHLHLLPQAWSGSFASTAAPSSGSALATSSSTVPITARDVHVRSVLDERTLNAALRERQATASNDDSMFRARAAQLQVQQPRPLFDYPSEVAGGSSEAIIAELFRNNAIRSAMQPQQAALMAASRYQEQTQEHDQNPAVSSLDRVGLPEQLAMLQQLPQYALFEQHYGTQQYLGQILGQQQSLERLRVAQQRQLNSEQQQQINAARQRELQSVLQQRVRVETGLDASSLLLRSPQEAATGTTNPPMAALWNQLETDQRQGSVNAAVENSSYLTALQALAERLQRESGEQN